MLYDGQCIRKCPSNETGTYPITYDAHTSEILNKHMFTGGSPDIGSSREIVISTIGPCVTYIPFQSDGDYISKGNGTEAGAALLMYECMNTYHPLNESFYRYKSECDVTTMSGYYLTSLILAGKNKSKVRNFPIIQELIRFKYRYTHFVAQMLGLCYHLRSIY